LTIFLWDKVRTAQNPVHSAIDIRRMPFPCYWTGCFKPTKTFSYIIRTNREMRRFLWPYVCVVDKEILWAALILWSTGMFSASTLKIGTAGSCEMFVSALNSLVLWCNMFVSSSYAVACRPFIVTFPSHSMPYNLCASNVIVGVPINMNPPTPDTKVTHCRVSDRLVNFCSTQSDAWSRIFLKCKGYDGLLTSFRTFLPTVIRRFRWLRCGR